VDIGPDEETLPLLMNLLKHTTFTGLRRLEVVIDHNVPKAAWRRAFQWDDNGPAFGPFRPIHKLRHHTPPEVRCLDPALARQLEEIIISLPRIRTFYQTSRFLAAFGEANRPGVLRFLPSTLILRDDPMM
jgi:hypothetical protein